MSAFRLMGIFVGMGAFWDPSDDILVAWKAAYMLVSFWMRFGCLGRWRVILRAGGSNGAWTEPPAPTMVQAFPGLDHLPSPRAWSQHPR